MFCLWKVSETKFNPSGHHLQRGSAWVFAEHLTKNYNSKIENVDKLEKIKYLWNNILQKGILMCYLWKVNEMRYKQVIVIPNEALAVYLQNF